MLNRNDRVALKRNRAGVSWLFFFSFILIIWIVNIYRDKDALIDESGVKDTQISEYQNIIVSKNKIIDSLNIVIIKYSQVKKDTIENKTIKQTLTKVKEKKDSSFVKLNTDTVKKDTIK